jgi:uncharacterized metal-binding protein
MPKGPAHFAASLALLGVGAAAVAITRQDSGVIVGLALGAFITPDIDQNQRTEEEKRVYNIPLIGWLVGPLWQALWWPYAKVAKHRGLLSHGPLISTAGRMFYLGLILALLRWLGVQLLGILPPYAPDTLDYWRWMLWPWPMLSIGAVYVGWAVQDVLHWIMDIVHSFFKGKEE